MLYAGIGPDVSTPLFLANATDIVGIDLLRVDAAALAKTLESSLSGQEFRADETLDDAIKLKTERGYWDQVDIAKLGIEKLLVLELKRLGVNLARVSVHDLGEGGTELNFEWKHPTEADSRRRSFKFAQSDALTYMSRKGLPEFDIFYKKSVPDIGGFDDAETQLLRRAADLIKTDGVILHSVPFSSEISSEENYTRWFDKQIGPEFKSFESSAASTLKMYDRMERFRSLSHMGYGWKLLGRKKLRGK